MKKHTEYVIIDGHEVMVMELGDATVSALCMKDGCSVTAVTHSLINAERMIHRKHLDAGITE